MTEARNSRDLLVSAMGLSLCVATNVNVIIWGNPGQGKSSIINTITSSFGFHLETVIASISEPTDFSGLPYFEGGKTLRGRPLWVDNVITLAAEQKKTSVVFYDELSTAPPAVQAATLRPILEKAVGEHQMPLTTRSIAAANPPSVAANGWELSPPTANRFTHIDWIMDAEYFKEGFVNGWPSLPALRFRGNAATRKEMRSKAMSLVGIFVHRRPEFLDGTPDAFGGLSNARNTGFRASQYAFPSPRSWEAAAAIYSSFKLATLGDGTPGNPVRPVPDAVLAMLLEGTIGIAATKEFLNFVRTLDLPDPHALLDGQVAFETSKRPDLLEATLSSLATAYKSRPSVDRWKRWGDILSEMTDAGNGDIAYKNMLVWKDNRPEGALPTSRHSKSLSALLGELNT